MSKPTILVDSFPPCLACGRPVAGASYRSSIKDYILWCRPSTAVTVRPCGHVLTGDTATIWASAALRRAA